MDGQTERTTPEHQQQAQPVLIDLGNLVALTEGQGGGHSEDKRRAYN